MGRVPVAFTVNLPTHTPLVSGTDGGVTEPFATLRNSVPLKPVVRFPYESKLAIPTVKGFPEVRLRISGPNRLILKLLGGNVENVGAGTVTIGL